MNIKDLLKSRRLNLESYEKELKREIKSEIKEKSGVERIFILALVPGFVEAYGKGFDAAVDYVCDLEQKEAEK